MAFVAESEIPKGGVRQSGARNVAIESDRKVVCAAINLSILSSSPRSPGAKKLERSG